MFVLGQPNDIISHTFSPELNIHTHSHIVCCAGSEEIGSNSICNKKQSQSQNMYTELFIYISENICNNRAAIQTFNIYCKIHVKIIYIHFDKHIWWKLFWNDWNVIWFCERDSALIMFRTTLYPCVAYVINKIIQMWHNGLSNKNSNYDILPWRVCQ